MTQPATEAAIASPAARIAVAAVARRRIRAVAAALAFAAAAAMLAYRTAGELNVPGDPLAPRFGLADFRDGVYFPVVSFLAGHDPYDPTTHLATYPVYYPFPLYSPALLLLHLPFGLLPFGAASWLYFALAVAGVLLVADLTLRLCDLPVTAARRFALAALILVSRPGHWSVFIGQFAVTLTVATYVALHFARRRPWLAAAGLAVAAIKPTFAIPLAVLLAARGEWRVVARGTALALALAAGPTAILVERAGGLGPFAAVLARSHAAFAAESTVDPSSSLYRVDTPVLAGRAFGFATGGVADFVIGAAILALAALAVRRLAAAASPAAARLGAAITCLAMLAWSYHQAYDQILLALPLLAAASGRWAPPAARGSDWARWTLVALLGACAVNYLASDNAVVALGIGGAWRPAVASLNSLAVIGALVISIAVAWRRSPPATSGSRAAASTAAIAVRLGAAARRHPAAVVGLIALAAALLRLAGSDGTLTDSDSWRQTDTATIARNFVETPSILWPQIDWGAPGPGYVEAEFQLYPFAVSLIYRAAGEHPLYGQLLSLALTALSCLVFFRLGRRFLSAGAALLAVALFAATPIVFRYAGAFMPEATVLLFYLLALDRFLAFLDARTWSAALAAGACTALAILVKPTSIHLGLVFLVLLVQRHGWRSLAGGPALALAAVALAPAIAYYAHAARIHALYGNTFGVISGGDSKWGGLDWWTDPRFWLRLTGIEVGWMAGPAGALLALYALAATRARRLRALALAWAASLLLYYGIVARYAGDPGRGLHYHLYAAPLYALLAAAGIALLRRRWRARPLAIGLVLLAVLGYQATIDGLVLARPKRPHLREAGLKLAQLSRPTDTVVVLSEDVASEGAVANNYEQPDVFFHARRRGRALAADRQTGPLLAAQLGADARWFVNFPKLNTGADASFRDALAGMRRVFAGDGFEIYAVGGRDIDAASGPRAAPPGGEAERLVATRGAKGMDDEP